VLASSAEVSSKLLTALKQFDEETAIGTKHTDPKSHTVNRTGFALTGIFLPR
jgi:hypothetical protein